MRMRKHSILNVDFSIKKPFWIFILGVQAILYFIFIWFTPRNISWQVLSLFSASFLIYWLLVKKVSNTTIQHIILVSILFRVIMLFGIPWLSDDFYRFVWDGFLSYKGMNPY